MLSKSIKEHLRSALFWTQVKDAPCDSKKIDQMCYEIKTFLLAGHETSAAMLAWALYELLKHPSYLAKVMSANLFDGLRDSR